MDQATIPIMSTTDMRSEVATWLNELDDNFLAAVHAMVGTYRAKQEAKVEEVEDEVIGYRVGTNEPLLASEADDVFEAIVDDVKQGNYVEVDDLIAQRSAQW
jgi:ClpP class serine protease